MLPTPASAMSTTASLFERAVGIRADSLTGKQTMLASLAGVLVGVITLTSLAPGLLVPARYQILGVPAWREVAARIAPSDTGRKKHSSKRLAQWIASERDYAWKRLLANIHPEGTDPGCVVASPSQKDPDYFYQWTRDSALVMKVVVEHAKSSGNEKHSQVVDKLVFDYIRATRKMQHMDTPSGGFHSGGLGEVKFNVDATPYTGSWGRPQGDGPALRATTMISFAEDLLDTDAGKWQDFVKKELYDSKASGTTESIIKADLDYVVEYWPHQCFDLWEEVNGVHHFNMLVSIRAMLDGVRFAARLGDDRSAAVYQKTADEITKSLGRFWDPDRNSLLATVDFKYTHGKLDWQDTGTVLGFVHSGDLSGSNAVSSNGFFGSDVSLASQYAVAESMRDVYDLNNKHYSRRKGNLGFAIGRYFEDVYDGDGKRKTGSGNPWYLCTMAHAEFMYRLIPYFANKPIQITAISYAFWHSLDYPIDSVNIHHEKDANIHLPGSITHAALLTALRDKGDAFLTVVKHWARWDGGLWEQFDRNNGGELGAPHLTWSYAAFMSCVAARDGHPMAPFKG